MVSNDAAGTAKRGPAITLEDVQSAVEPMEGAAAGGAGKSPAGAGEAGKAAARASKGKTGKAKGKAPAAAPGTGNPVKPATRKQAPAKPGKNGPAKGAEGKKAKPASPVQRLSRIATAAVVVAVIAVGYGIYAHVTSAERYAVLDQEITAIVVATHDIQPGTEIGSGDVELREVPASTVPAGATDSLADVVGMTSTALIPGNAGVVAGNVASGRAATLAGRIDSDKVAITISTNQQTGIAGLVHQGDRVTVLAGDGAGSFSAIAKGAKVLSLDASMDLYSSGYASITVEVPASEAAEIAAALSGGSVTCILEPASSAA